MVKTCQIDGDVEDALIKKLEGGSAPQDGTPPLRIAKAASSSTGKKGTTKKEQVSAVLDSEWVLEHALEVARTLPGGLHVLGLFLRAPEGTAAAASASVATVLKGIRDHADMEAPCVLLTADSASHRLAVRAGLPGELHPAELRTTRGLAAGLVLVTARVPLSLTVPTSAMPPPPKTVRHAVAQACKRLKEAAVQWPDGSLTPPMPDKADAALHGPVVESVIAASSTDAMATVACTVLQPLIPPSSTAQQDVQGALLIQGTLTAVAIVPRRTTTAAAAVCLQQDARRSLQARLDLAEEDALEQGAALFAEGDKSTQLRLARRVAVTTQRAGLPMVWDYMSHGEDRTAIAERIQELFGWQVDAARQVAVLEATGPGVALDATWDPAAPVAGPRHRAASVGSARALTGLVRVVWLLLAAALALALVAAWLHSVGGGGEEEAVEALRPEEMTETWE